MTSAPSGSGAAEPEAGSRVVLGRRAGGAVFTQFLNAGGSLVLQVVAARTLGKIGFADFAVCVATLALVNTFHTGWVGDGLTVLDRHDRAIRRALVASQLGTMALGSVVGVAVALAFGVLHPVGCLLFAVAISLWLLEETGRRIMSARLEFGRLIVNDAVYVVASLAAVIALRMVFGHFSVEILIGAIACGALAAIVAAQVQLPAEELQLVAPGTEALGEVAEFSSWRAMQVAIRPLALLILRFLVVTLASKAALATVEAGRLMMAPAITFISGAGTFLLPFFAHSFKSRRREFSERMVTVAMVGMVGMYTIVAVLLRSRLAPLLTDGKVPVGVLVLLSWAVFTAAYGAGLPAGASLAARRESRLVFMVRVGDSLLGTAVAAAMIVLWHPEAGPLGLGIGLTIGACVLTVLVERANRSAGTVDDEEELALEGQALAMLEEAPLIGRVRIRRRQTPVDGSA